MGLVLGLVPLAGTALASVGMGQLHKRQYVGWFAAGAVFAAAGGSLFSNMNGAKPAFAVLLGLALGCVAGIAMYAFTEFLWPRNQVNKRGNGGTARKGENFITSTVLAMLTVAFSIGVVYSAKIVESMSVMLSFAMELFWLAFSVGIHVARLGERVTMGLLLAVIVWLGQMVGMALGEGLIGASLVATLALGNGAVMYMAIYPLFADPNKSSKPQGLAASFLTGYGSALAFMAIV